MATKTGICKFCLQEKKLIKAHIIPKYFQDAVKDDSNTMLSIRLDKKTVVPKNDFLFDLDLLAMIVITSSPRGKIILLHF